MAFVIPPKSKRPVLEKIELPGGVTCWCRPATTPVWEAAMAYARRTLAALVAGSEVMEDLGLEAELLPQLADQDGQEGIRRLLFVQALARHAIVRWSGVLQMDENRKKTKAPVTPAAIAQMMLIHRMSDEFIIRYGRNVHERFDEGNGSRPLPNGTSVEGLNTATGARSGKRPAPPAAEA